MWSVGFKSGKWKLRVGYISHTFLSRYIKYLFGLILCAFKRVFKLSRSEF